MFVFVYCLHLCTALTLKRTAILPVNLVQRFPRRQSTTRQGRCVIFVRGGNFPPPPGGMLPPPKLILCVIYQLISAFCIQKSYHTHQEQGISKARGGSPPHPKCPCPPPHATPLLPGQIHHPRSQQAGAKLRIRQLCCCPLPFRNLFALQNCSQKTIILDFHNASTTTPK